LFNRGIGPELGNRYNPSGIILEGKAVPNLSGYGIAMIERRGSTVLADSGFDDPDDP
jgi:hypothetical protein